MRQLNRGGGIYSQINNDNDISDNWEKCRSNARELETHLEDVTHSFVELNTKFGQQLKNRNVIQEHELVKSYDPERYIHTNLYIYIYIIC